MKNKAYDINNYIFNKEDVFMLDANIWLFLFPAPSSSQYSYIKKYDDFAIIDVNQILDDFENGVVDFTDGVIADCCLRNNWKLITDDGDFTTGGIEVITTNQKLITGCR